MAISQIMIIRSLRVDGCQSCNSFRGLDRMVVDIVRIVLIELVHVFKKMYKALRLACLSRGKEVAIKCAWL